MNERICPHCQKPVVPSELPQYDWQCLDCDEDFFDFECTEEGVTDGVTFKELRLKSGMSRPKFAEYFEIPYRTVQSWELYGESVEGRKCPDYLMKLLEYKLEKEELLKAGD